MREPIKLEFQTQLFNAIKANDSLTLKRFYTVNYPKVEALILNNNGTKDYAKDIYQEAFIVVWTHVKNNTFIPKSESALEGYLYQIAKNKWMDVLRSSQFKKTKSIQNDSILNSNDDDSNDELQQQELLNKQLQQTMDAFKILGEPCKSLLKTFYFEKKSLRDIAETLQIEESTARNKKYRCMEKLRDIIIASKS